MTANWDILTIIKFVLAFGLATELEVPNTCPYKDCFCGTDIDTILCNDRNFREMPHLQTNVSTSINSLDLDRNNITRIPALSLPANLSDISMESVPIEFIDDTAFDASINTLQSLTFSQARFTQIPKALFNLKALKTLRISETTILVWDEDDMKKLGATLEILDLETVGLTTWPGWLQTFSKLTELTVTGSSISAMPDDAFDTAAATLTILVLSNNSFTSVPQALSKLTKLQELYLDSNKITDVTWLPQLAKLNTLKLNNNKITDVTQLSNVLRIYGNTLSGFVLDHNSLTSLPDLSFLSLIAYLDFSYNQISDIHFISLHPNVTELNLGYNFLAVIPDILNTLMHVSQLTLNSNRIQKIQDTNFSPSVTDVQLGYNLITELKLTSFPKNSSISSLILNNNPLATISPDAFNNLIRLANLDLSQTKLTRVPLAIGQLTNLFTLDISDCDNLVCTCMEKSLQTRIRSLYFADVVGDCGRTSVYVFFTELSPGCP